jgi:hypothetical protein
MTDLCWEHFLNLRLSVIANDEPAQTMLYASKVSGCQADNKLALSISHASRSGPKFSFIGIRVPHNFNNFFAYASIRSSLGKLMSSNFFAYGVGTSAPVIRCAGASK